MKMSSNKQLFAVRENDWWNRFKNILFVELGDFWKSKDWIWMSLLWIGIGNGISALTYLGGGDVEMMAIFNIFFIFIGLFPPIATILVMQDSIVGEQRSGAILWLLSKPISRQSFIFAKWLGNSINLLVCITIIPGTIGYFEFSAFSGEWLSPILYFTGISILMLYHLFFIGFTLLLGTIMDTPGGVAAPPMILNFAQQFFQSIPFASHVLPLTLFLNQPSNSVILSIILGEIPSTIIPIVSTGIFAVLFLFLAIWKFNKVDL
jgi:ABC-type transport system involved in multi-copper enzyme maturation permease subunit